MKYSFSVCCFVLEFFLTFWSEFITSTEITASPSVSPLLAANPIFFRLLSKAAYTLCGIMTNHCRIVLMDMCLVFSTITIQFRLSFHNCKCENTYLVDYTVVVFLICWLILDHWFIVWLIKVLQDLCSWSLSYLDYAFGYIPPLNLWAWKLLVLFMKIITYLLILFYPCYGFHLIIISKHCIVWL